MDRVRRSDSLMVEDRMHPYSEKTWRAGQIE